MNEEEIETLCNTGELEVVKPSVVFQRNTKNKCGNILRDGIVYPDIIELLVLDELKRYSWGRDRTHPMMNNFFPGFNDIYFVLSENRGIRQNGNYTEYAIGFGMYFSRTNYTIEEDDSYYYVTTKYDLYVHDKIVDPRVMTSDEPLRILPTGPIHERQDEVAREIIRRGHEQNDNRRRRDDYYRPAQHSQLREHVVNNILPELKEHASNAERSTVKHVPNALAVCSAIAKDLTVVPIMDLAADDSQRQYSWLEPSELQNSIRALCVNMATYTREDHHSSQLSTPDGLTYRHVSNVIDVKTDGSHHKKNEMMILTIKNNIPTVITGATMPDSGIWYAQVISTSESPGDLKSVLSRNILDEQPQTDLTRKVLMSKKAEVSHYSNDEVKISLDRLTPNALTLVRVRDPSKSPKGSTLMDICQFGDGVYEAIVDRPMELARGDRSIKLGPGTYSVCVDDIENTDFLWYTGLASNDFCNIEIKEIHSRLNLFEGSDDRKYTSTNVGDKRLTFSQSSDTKIRSTGRFGRRISFDNLNEEN